MAPAYATAQPAEPETPLSFDLERIEGEGPKVSPLLLVRVRGTGASSGAEVALDVAPGVLRVTAPAGELRIPLPADLAPAEEEPNNDAVAAPAAAKWRKKTKTLEISFPLRHEVPAAPPCSEQSPPKKAELPAPTTSAAAPLPPQAFSGGSSSRSIHEAATVPPVVAPRVAEQGFPARPLPTSSIVMPAVAEAREGYPGGGAAAAVELGQAPPKGLPEDPGAAANTPKDATDLKKATPAAAAVAPAPAPAAAAAVGSIWNAGSWHWEERNHSEHVREALRVSLSNLKIELPEQGPAAPEGASQKGRGGPLKIVFSSVDVSGDASGCVRKGKRILLFELKLEAMWQCAGTNERGKLKVPELSNDTPADVAVLEITRSKRAGQPTEPGPAEKALRAKRSEAVAALRAALATAEAALRAADDRGSSSSGGGGKKAEIAKEEAPVDKEALLRADSERRAEEQRKAEAARAASGEAQKRIAQEEKDKEERRILEAKARAYLQQVNAAPATTDSKGGDEEAGVGAAAAAGAAPPPAASVWNPRGYHWEERPQTAWAKEFLISRFGRLGPIPLMRGAAECRLTQASFVVEGHASTSLRRGKKIVLFELQVTLPFVAQLLDGGGQELGRCEGELKIEEFTSEDPEGRVRVETTKVKGQGRQLAKELEQSACKQPVQNLLHLFREKLQER